MPDPENTVKKSAAQEALETWASKAGFTASNILHARKPGEFNFQLFIEAYREDIEKILGTKIPDRYVDSNHPEYEDYKFRSIILHCNLNIAESGNRTFTRNASEMAHDIAPYNIASITEEEKAIEPAEYSKKLAIKEEDKEKLENAIFIESIEKVIFPKACTTINGDDREKAIINLYRDTVYQAFKLGCVNEFYRSPNKNIYKIVSQLITFAYNIDIEFWCATKNDSEIHKLQARRAAININIRERDDIKKIDNEKEKLTDKKERLEKELIDETKQREEIIEINKIKLSKLKRELKITDLDIELYKEENKVGSDYDMTKHPDLISLNEKQRKLKLACLKIESQISRDAHEIEDRIDEISKEIETVEHELKSLEEKYKSLTYEERKQISEIDKKITFLKEDAQFRLDFLAVVLENEEFKNELIAKISHQVANLASEQHKGDSSPDRQFDHIYNLYGTQESQ